jgi:hypothetical protein
VEEDAVCVLAFLIQIENFLVHIQSNDFRSDVVKDRKGLVVHNPLIILIMAPSQPPAAPATSSAVSLVVLSEPLLQRRLDAGLAIAGGARGSLTRALHGYNNATTTTTSSASAPAQLLQLEMTKLALILQRNELMLEKCRRAEEEQVQAAAAAATATTTTGHSSTNNDITSMRQRLSTARTVHSCWQNYEGLATAILQKHVVSESRLIAELQMVESQYKLAQQQLQKAQLTAKTRAAQCHLLQRCVLDLQQSVVEEEEEEEGEEKEHRGGGGSKKMAAGGERPVETTKGGDKMDGDGDAVMKDASAAAAVEEDDEEGELLYGDLDSHL